MGGRGNLSGRRRVADLCAVCAIWAIEIKIPYLPYRQGPLIVGAVWARCQALTRGFPIEGLGEYDQIVHSGARRKCLAPYRGDITTNSDTNELAASEEHSFLSPIRCSVLGANQP